MILGQVAPIPHIAFVIAFITTKQSKTKWKAASLVQGTFSGHTSLKIQGMLRQVGGSMLSVAMDKHTHYDWLLLSFTFLLISRSISSSLNS